MNADNDGPAAAESPSVTPDPEYLPAYTVRRAITYRLRPGATRLEVQWVEEYGEPVA
jgi:hypothetical protein